MNRWTGTGHLTKDPKFLETESGTAICTLRIAVKRAGKQGQDGYFDVKCFDAPGVGVRAVPQGRARGRRRRPAAVRRVPDPGRRLRLARLHRRRARRVPRQPQGRSNGQASAEASPEQPATRRRGARGPPGRLTTIAGPRRSTGRGPDDFHGDRHEHHDHHPDPQPHETVSRFLAALAGSAGPRRAARAALPPRRRAAHGAALRPPDRGCADSRRGRSRSAGAPTSTSAARRAPAGTAAATPSSAPSCCGPTATATHAVAALRALRAGAVDRDRLRHRQQLPRLLAAHRAARRRRARARQPPARARARRRPRLRRRRADPARPRHATRTSTSRRPPVEAIRARRRAPRCAVADVVGALPDPPQPARATPSAPDSSIAAMTRCWRSRPTSTCGGCSASRCRAIARCRCPFHADRHASLHVYETAERGWYCFGRCRRGGTIYDLAAPLYGYDRARRGLPPPARRAAAASSDSRRSR